MKKKCEPGGFKEIRLPKFFLKMKFLLCLVLLSFQLSASIYSQNARLTLTFSDVSLREAFTLIRQQSGYTFVYNVDDVKNIRVEGMDLKEVSLDEALRECLRNTRLSYVIEDNVIIVTPQSVKSYKISGTVRDTKGTPLPGVTVLIKGTQIGAATDTEGKFTFTVASPDNNTLIFSFIGMKTKEVTAGVNKPVNVVLEDDALEMEEVVVNAGYFQKTKESFTGSEVTVKAEELKKVGSLNVIAALSAFDPSIRLTEDLVNGSNPNRVPEITVRGENGFDLRSNADDSRSNPNAPLYVLDGVEVTAQRVYDLDMNRVEDMTILKDATATALYGSRGANGVILITTIRPRAGQIRITGNANFNVSIPDLRDYNLMNAREKLTFEKLSGAYRGDTWQEQLQMDQVFNQRWEAMLEGVDTYWLSKPLQRALNQRYSLSFEGGDDSFRYGIDLRYNGDKGVMKGSGRANYGISVIFQYNIGKDFFIRNDILVDNVKGEESPYGSFATWAGQNPYDRVYDENGDLVEKLSSADYNPMINATLPNFDINEYTSVQDNFNIDWRIIPSIRLQGRFSYTKQLDKSEKFLSPKSVEFAYMAADIEDREKKKGSYYIKNGKSNQIDANMTLSYFKNIGKHVINLGVGGNWMMTDNKADWYTAVGFVSESIDFVGAGTAFKDKSTPSGSFDKTRLVGFFGNVNYGYDNRYFLDLSYRTDGSSKFGRNSRFASFWSAGVAWNLHKEHFVNWDSRNSLKLRFSVGSTGNVNFSSSQAMTTYKYDFDNEYNGYYGTMLKGYGNPKLKWQNTVAYNLGLDWALLKGRIQLNADAYIKITDNLLLPIDVAPSTGFYSYTENLGKLENRGIEGRLRVNIIDNREKDLNWNVTLAAFKNMNKIKKLSNQLEKMNEEAQKESNLKGGEVYREYAEGRSQSALMIVRSAGIDPATGNEIFIKRDGSYTFVYDYRDKVNVGDMMPKIEGNINSNLNWKGINLYLLFRYRYGGKLYNSTLADKVENDWQHYQRVRNKDKRALYDRWMNPGDEALYRRIDEKTYAYQTTRLVQEDNLFSLESVSLSYDLPLKYASRIGAERLKFMVSTTDVFRISSIKQERGTAYPFARTFTAGVNVTF